jgi:hypothetical protein
MMFARVNYKHRRHIEIPIFTWRCLSENWGQL